jgi:hypothetical protein
MDPSIAAGGVSPSLLPSATSWYMNPFFLASFGAFAALGFVMLTLAYFILGKLKRGEGMPAPDDRCATCGITGDMVGKLIPCQAHGEIKTRVETIDKWILSHEGDYRELRQRIDRIERSRASESASRTFGE